MATTGWTLEGTDLRTLAYEIRSVTGWDSTPRKRGKNLDVPWTDGRHSIPRKYFTAREIPLRLLIMDTDAAGFVTHPEGRSGHLRQNIDALQGLLYKRDGLLDLRKTVPDAAGGTHERQALVEVLEFTPVEEADGLSGADGSIREVLIRFEHPAALWRELPLITQTEAGVTTDTHGFNIAVGGNAPCRDFVIEWTANSGIANPRLETDVNGEFVQYSGTLDAAEVLTIDLAAKTAVIDGTERADSGLTFGNAWWIDLDPAATTAVTASVTSASDFDIEIRRYDKWF